MYMYIVHTYILLCKKWGVPLDDYLPLCFSIEVIRRYVESAVIKLIGLTFATHAVLQCSCTIVAMVCNIFVTRTCMPGGSSMHDVLSSYGLGFCRYHT